MGEDKTGAEAVKSDQAGSVDPGPADVNERADAIDATTDGDGVARFDAAAREPGAE